MLIYDLVVGGEIIAKLRVSKEQYAALYDEAPVTVEATEETELVMTRAPQEGEGA